jgi:hypothetical protein
MSMNYVYLAVAIYLIGLAGWFVVWRCLVGGRELFREVPLLYIPFWGAVVVLVVNAFLASLAEIPEYGVEVGIYGFVETNAMAVATFSLGIAIFVVLTFDKFSDILDDEESKQFIILLFSSFLFSVIGVLPLYWVPQIFGWLTTLRHLKTVPYTYSVFIFAAAMIFYIHEVHKTRKSKASADGGEEAPSSEKPEQDPAGE